MNIKVNHLMKIKKIFWKKFAELRLVLETKFSMFQTLNFRYLLSLGTHEQK